MRRKEMKRRGQTLVEMALILPILILILLGLIEFGRALFIYTVVSNAAREGARHGIVEPLNGAAIEQAVYDRLVLVPSDTVSVGSSIQFPIAEPPGYTPGKSRIIVTVDYQFQMITPFMAQIFPPTQLTFTSGRTIQGGARARTTFLPGTVPPGEITPATPMTWAPTRTRTQMGMSTPTPDTPLYTPTEGPSPTPQVLNIVYVDGYPCRGEEQNANRGYVRLEVFVTDAGGNPVIDADVAEDLEGTVLVHIGGGRYGAVGGCWRSANYHGDTTIRVTASKTGFTGDFVDGSTVDNPHCSGCSAGLATNTPTPTSSTPTPPTPTPTSLLSPTPSLSPTPVTPTATPSRTPTPTVTPTPLPLVVTYVANYPARGIDQNSTKGAIRVKVYVTSGGLPVTGATVTVDVEGGTLTDLGGGYYGGGGSPTNCWVSSGTSYGDRSVTVTAAKAGYETGSVTAPTDPNPHGTSCP